MSGVGNLPRVGGGNAPHDVAPPIVRQMGQLWTRVTSLPCSGSPLHWKQSASISGLVPVGPQPFLGAPACLIQRVQSADSSVGAPHSCFQKRIFAVCSFPSDRPDGWAIANSCKV